MAITRTADEFFKVGCGRCARGGTPDCKVHRWAKELALLRTWCLQAGLDEESKWGVPVYTQGGRLVLMLSALNESCVLGFVNTGDELEDPHGLLTKAGPHSVRDRVIRWTSVQEIQVVEKPVRDLILRHARNMSKVQKAKAVKGRTEKAGAEKAGTEKAGAEKASLPEFPQELKDFMAEHPDFAAAFDRLTPGRRRGYLIFVSGAVQSATRTRRIASIVPKVLAGKGLQD